MIRKNSSEKGQALILIVFAIIGMLALVGLALDGGNTYSDRRQAQNAADAAAMAAALAYQNDNAITDIALKTTAWTVAGTNGYPITANVVVEPSITPTDGCPGNAAGKDIKVTITSTVKTWFAPVVGVKEVTNTVTSTSRACAFHIAPIFDGNAIVSLKDFNTTTNPLHNDQCGLYIQGSSGWDITGGGVFSNGCAVDEHGNVHFLTADKCANTVGRVDGFSCENPHQATYDSTYVDSIMPPEPACDGTPTGGIVVPNNPTSFNFSNGIYCVYNFDAFGDKNVVLENAVLYVMDPNGFTPPTMKYTGTGFSGTGYSAAGDYAGYYLIIKPGTIGTQEMEWRGNGTGAIYGTIFAPTTVFDLRGNAYNIADHSQIIGYQVETLGNAYVSDIYKQEENHRKAFNPFITLLK